VKKWAGRHHQISAYRWINGVPPRDGKDALMVNYLYLQIKNGDAGKAAYTNSWVTGKEIREDNVELLAPCVRGAAEDRKRTP
jgi:hypothetical protein